MAGRTRGRVSRAFRCREEFWERSLTATLPLIITLMHNGLTIIYVQPTVVQRHDLRRIVAEACARRLRRRVSLSPFFLSSFLPSFLPPPPPLFARSSFCSRSRVRSTELLGILFSNSNYSCIYAGVTFESFWEIEIIRAWVEKRKKKSLIVGREGKQYRSVNLDSKFFFLYISSHKIL